MRTKTCLSIILAASLTSAICVTAHAATVASTSAMSGTSLVQIIDGKDNNDSVAIRALITKGKNHFDKKLQESHFEFGFMEGDSFVSITGCCGNKGIHDFSPGSAVDFALRQTGAGADKIYRLSDSTGYAKQKYFGWIKPAKSRNPEVLDEYYRGVRISWDLDLDDKTDVRILITTKGHARFDGVRPASSNPSVLTDAPVPLPAALWLMASGLLGLAGFARSRERQRR